jgi:hypothetical protein
MTLPAGARRITRLEDVAGVWVGLEPDRLYHRFNVDGTCYSSVSLQNLNTNPAVEATCRFEGHAFITTDVKTTGLPSCGGKPGTYEVHLLANGNILFARIFETCAPRGRSMAMEHERVYESQ